jgi:hypothetical protein
VTTISCPICKEITLTQEAPGVLVCEHCRARIVQGQLQCPSCKSSNPIGTETCVTCGEPLTIFGRVISRQGGQTKSHRLEQMRSRASEIKEKERASSEVRMAGFKKIDRRRMEFERKQLLAQRLRDRRLFRNVAIGLGLFFLIVTIISLVVLL